MPQPTSVNGTKVTPIEGTSMVYTFNDAKAPDRHTTQYFEMFGNRAMYKDGWLARTIHRPAWRREPLHTLQEDVWELYNDSEDFSLANNIADKHPEKLKELQDLFI